MRKVLILILVGMTLTLSSQTLFKDTYLFSQPIVDSYRFKQDTGMPTNGLIAYYPFNGNANDESVNGNDGTVINATLTTGVDGSANRAYSFNGTGYIDIGSDASLQPTSELTVCAWVKIGSTVSFNRIVSYDNGSSTYNGWTIREVSGVFDILVSTDVTRIPGTGAGDGETIPEGVWQMLAMTYDGSNAIGYQNAVETINESITGNIVYTGTTVANVGGRQNASNLFTGDIGFVEIYNRALSPEEITIIYNIQKP
jgi:hypothetical protein